MASEEIIQLMGCVIRWTCPGVKDEQSGSGVVLIPQEGLILGQGSLLASLCFSNKALASRIYKGEFIGKEFLDSVKFEIMLDSRWNKASSNKRRAKEKVFEPEPFLSSDSVSSSFPRIYSCQCLAAYRNAAFHSVMCKVMPAESWTFESDIAGETEGATVENKKVAKENIEENKITYHLLSYFLIFKMEPITLVDTHLLTCFKDLEEKKVNQPLCSIGDAAEIVATPFGSQNPSVFFNSYSRGIISNVQGCWIVTDARCIPGSEGGPLFIMKQDGSRYLTGMVVASLCWKNKEWVGFSLACSLKSILSHLVMQTSKMNTKLQKLVNVKALDEKISSSTLLKYSDSLLPVAACTVLVRVGATWGSGVVVNKALGIILTCSHVIKDSQHHIVSVKTIQDSTEYKAQVLYSHKDHPHGPFDIAVLLCPEATSSIVDVGVPPIRPPKLGERVVVSGHALFSSDLQLLPSVTSGVISKLIDIHGHLCMVQTTCAVHAGTSGGPLLSQNGALLGIVVCNTVDKGSNSSYPHLNMSIPAYSLLPALNSYIGTQDPSVFSSFLIKDKVVRKLWALENTTLENFSQCSKSKLYFRTEADKLTNLFNMNDTSELKLTNLLNMNDTSTSELKLTNLLNMNDTSTSELKLTNLLNMNDTSTSELKLTNLLNMNDTSELKLTNLLNMNDTSELKLTNLLNMNDTSTSELKLTNLFNMNDTS
ncbi:peroxisomal leader peptide-processing protease-like isoform X2 [Biomphalaria glabrata]